jgi:hypothetical protein
MSIKKYNSGFSHGINFIKPGEPVTASVAGRPDREIHQNVEYVYQALRSAGLGHQLILRGAPSNPDVELYSPVYWNSQTSLFEPAKAGLVPNGPILEPMESMDVWGMVISKSGATVDIGVYGVFENLDISSVVEGEVVDGRYYLSASTPGKLVSRRPSVGHLVCKKSANKILVNPQFREYPEGHVHYKFDLVCLPAGDHTPPEPDERHVITNPDANLPGWLPADHIVFNGEAPEGAVFGYNLAAHPDPALLEVWPPLPIGGAVLILDKGVDGLGGTFVPLGPERLAVINEDGIWWFSDVFEDAPWPSYYDSEVGIDPLGSNPPEGPESPRLEDMRLSLYFSNPTIASDRAVVQSLHADPDGPIRLSCDGVAAETGHITITFVWDQIYGTSTKDGSLVFKSVDEDGKIERGHVVEKIRFSPAFTVTSTVNQTVGNVIDHKGSITVSLAADTAYRELAPASIHVNDAEVEIYSDKFLCYAMLPGRVNSIKALFTLTSNTGVSGKATLKIRAFLPSAGTVPDLAVTVKTTAPGYSSLPADIDDQTATVTGGAVVGDKCSDFTTEEFDVVPGAELDVIITRSASDGYSGKLYIRRIELVAQ